MKFLSCGLVESEVTMDAADYHNLTYFTGAVQYDPLVSFKVKI